MTERGISFQLPKPWINQTFAIEKFGKINFFVGPNGSGKSRFAAVLKSHLPNARLLGTDRLTGTGAAVIANIIGDSFAQGFQKNHFSLFKQAGASGSGIDTFVILEERPDIRVIVEATLSNLFNREISLEWDSGNLVPKALSVRSGETYRIDREECHGIRELLVLLTHLHNDAHEYLIIDEPELNLHPQFQSFFMQEVRKIVSAPTAGAKKSIFLITHSPFIVDLKSIDDLCSVFSFSADHSPPTSISNLGEGEGERFASLISRLNVHHKQLFFSDNPIFVEGTLDAQIIEAIQEQRQVSVTAAGSCIIDVGGCEEVSKYLEFCRKFKKSAYFFYDLDSLFVGSLRKCIRADGSVGEFLATLGLGVDFGRYCGELDQKLTAAIDAIRSVSEAPINLQKLKQHIEQLAGGDALRDQNLSRARVAVLMDLMVPGESLTSIIGSSLSADIKGRLARVLEILSQKNVFVLPAGALEHYLPEYRGDRYILSEGAKRTAVAAEVSALASGVYLASLHERYGALFENICKLPAKAPVDIDTLMKKYLGDYVHALQGLVLSHMDWTIEQFNSHFSTSASGLGKLFQVTAFERLASAKFNATISISGSTPRFVKVSDQTNAGMRQFTFEAAAPV